MADRQTSRLSSRKEPSQERSRRLVADILEAAIRVLARDGAHRFTTTRVAETAGVSVGSLYQYFPSKEALLFRLQTDEWRQTGGMLHDMLADRGLPPFERLRRATRAFFRSEVEEVALRAALGHAAPLYRDAPQMRDQRRAGLRRAGLFLREAIPQASPRQRALAADLVTTALTAIGAQVSEQDRAPAAIDALADATGDMLCAWLKTLNRPQRGEARAKRARRA